MKILLAGRDGQLARELRSALVGVGELIASPRSEMDITDAASVHEALDSHRPDLIINAAGYTWVDRAEHERDAAFAANGTGPNLLARWARAHGAAIIHFSTDYIFDGAKAQPYTEDDEPNPLSVYGRSKLAGEEAVLGLGASAIVFRLSWLYSMHGRNFVRTILQKAETERELRIVHDQVGSPTWARTVAYCTAEVIQGFARRDMTGTTFGGLEGIYHLACSGQTSWHGFAQRILDFSGLDAPPIVTPIPSEAYPTSARRPHQSALCSDKAHKTFGLEPVDWEHALRCALQDLRNETMASQHAAGGGSR